MMLAILFMHGLLVGMLKPYTHSQKSWILAGTKNLPLRASSLLGVLTTSGVETSQIKPLSRN